MNLLELAVGIFGATVLVLGVAALIERGNRKRAEREAAGLPPLPWWASGWNWFRVFVLIVFLWAVWDSI